MMRKYYNRLRLWWWRFWHSPYFKTKDGIQYGRRGETIYRLDDKKVVKKQAKLKELREFFK